MKILTILTAALIALGPSLHAGQPVELGKVDWLRDLDEALTQSKKSEKPVFALFQEVPGCAGCKQFGEDVLSDPRIVESIESAFVPLAIYNNQGGKDREVLRKYNEPAWNYQVVRFLDSDGTDIIPRKDRVWSSDGIAERMIQTLKEAGRPIPDKLQSFMAGAPNQLETGAFAMFCFWEGEAKLGGLAGVAETEAGWIDGREVVRVKYDPEQVSWGELVKSAASFDCANQIYAPGKEELEQTRKITRTGSALLGSRSYRPAKESDQKRVLKQTKLRQLDLTCEQATKINAALATGKDPRPWLTDAQIREVTQ